MLDLEFEGERSVGDAYVSLCLKEDGWRRLVFIDGYAIIRGLDDILGLWHHRIEARKCAT